LNVWLARHASSSAPPGRAWGWTDFELSAAGRRQVRALARNLADVPLDHVFSSDLQRSWQTAEGVARAQRIPVQRSSRLREVNFGAWEGQRLEALWDSDPLQAQAWESDPRNFPASFGESYAQFERRVHGFLDSIPRCENLLVVAHRGSLALLEAKLTRSTFAQTFARGLAPGAVTRLVTSSC